MGNLMNIITFATLIEISTNKNLITDASKDRQYEKSAVDVRFNDNPARNHHRSLATDLEKELQQKWSNWNFCTNAYFNTSFTPMNSLVPENTVFLSNYPTDKLDNSSATCKTKAITRTGTIKAGKQTVFFPLSSIGINDFTDDWKLGICASSQDETESQRFEAVGYFLPYYNDPGAIDLLYASVDGEPVTPLYIYNTDEVYFSACPDNRMKTTEEISKLTGVFDGDTCDEEPFQAIEGLDYYPILGWYGIDTREWVDGESHTYEFGSLYECQTGKYILTAQSENSGANNLFGYRFYLSICILLLLQLISFVCF